MRDSRANLETRVFSQRANNNAPWLQIGWIDLSLLVTCGMLLAATVLLAGCASTNSIAQREIEAEKIPQHIKEFARPLVAPIGDLQRMHGLGAGTGQLLPNGDILTAAHVVQSATERDQTIRMYLDGSAVKCSVVDIHPHSTVRGAFEFLEDEPIQDAILLRPDFSLPAIVAQRAMRAPEPIEQRLTDPLRNRIRFDPSRSIPKGTVLYAFGFVYSTDRDNDQNALPFTIAIVRGEATTDSSPEQPIWMQTDCRLDIHGMSGGPIAIYDESTDELIVVGILSCTASRFSFPWKAANSFVGASRIPIRALDASQQ